MGKPPVICLRDVSLSFISPNSNTALFFFSLLFFLKRNSTVPDSIVHADMDPEKQQRIIELAALEGHDADIPSNAGRIELPIAEDAEKLATSTPATIASTSSNFEKDIEKHAASRRESSSSSRADFTAEKDGQGSEKPVDEESEDPNIVSWDGPNDPSNPMNWSSGRKWGAMAVVSGVTFLTPLGSSIFAPGVQLVMTEFKSNNTLLEGFIVSVYVLGFAFGPLGETFPTQFLRALSN